MYVRRNQFMWKSSSLCLLFIYRWMTNRLSFGTLYVCVRKYINILKFFPYGQVDLYWMFSFSVWSSRFHLNVSSLLSIKSGNVESKTKSQTRKLKSNRCSRVWLSFDVRRTWATDFAFFYFFCFVKPTCSIVICRTWSVK